MSIDLATIARMEQRPLPGHGDFLELSGYQRPDLAQVRLRRPEPKESAVLLLLYPEAGSMHTLLMLRPTYQGVHSGQVGFPGGHREAYDVDLRATALREFGEEIGAATGNVRVIREMTPVYIPPSHSVVTPVLAYAPQLGPTAPDPREVAGLIPIAVAHLLRDDILKRTRMFVKAVGHELDVPYWDVDGHMVWGATALMIAELRALFREDL